MADISKITLPSGGTYNLKDAEARRMIAAGITFIRCTNAANTPYGVTWDYDGTTITGTLVASSTTKGSFYLVPDVNAAGLDIWDEYVTIQEGTDPNFTYSWERLGSTDIDLSDLGALAYKDSVSLNQDTATVLGSNSTFSLPQTSVSMTNTKKTLGVSLSGGDVTDVTGSAIVSVSESGTDTFVKSYPGATSKLVTQTIHPVAGTTTVPNVTGNNSVSATHIDSYGTASTFTYTVANETLTIAGSNSTAPTGTDVTATNVTLGTDITVATMGSEVTVATGSLSGTGTGGTVMTGLGTATTASAVTGVSSSSGTFVTGTTYTAPTASLGEKTGTGTYEVMTNASGNVPQTSVNITKDNKTVLTSNTTVTVS